MFGDGFDRFFLDLLNTGFAASVVIFIVLLLRLVLRRAPKRYSYLLWAPALLRLLCPFSIESVFSLLPANPAPIPENIAQMQTPQLDTGFVALNRVVNAALPAAQPQNSVNPMQVILFVGQLIWLVGVAGLLLYAGISTLRLRHQLRGAMRREENVYVLPGLKTPFVMGIFRPRIYLPDGLAEGEQQYILLHERIHLRRKDHLIRLLSFFAVCLHWFNPLVWLAYHLSARDMEMSCDEAVVRQMGEKIKRPYSASLLALASGRRWVSGAPLAFGEGDTRPRIKNVLHYRKPAVWAGALLAVLVVVLCVGLALNPSKEGALGTGSSSSSGQSGAQAMDDDSLDRFTIFALDVAGLGDHGLQVSLGTAQSEVMELLNPNEWRLPGEGELPETGTSPVLTLLSGEGEVLDVCPWENGQSLIMLRSADESKKEIYLAPDTIAQQASAFSEKFVSSTVSPEDWVRAILWTVSATPQSTSLIIPQGIDPDETISVEISALIPREENGIPYTERVTLLEGRKSVAEWDFYCEGIFPYEDCPDGTELSVMVHFLEQEGDSWISSSWGYRSYKCEDGEMVEQVVPANTAVTVSNKANGDETLVTLRYTETVGNGFSVTFALPQGWTVSTEGGGADFALAAGAQIFAPGSDEPVGWIGYDLLGSHIEQYEPPQEEDQVFYYSQLMLGSVVNWNNEYQELLREGDTVSATCLVGYHEGGAGGTTQYDWGILARDERIGRFVGIKITRDAIEEDALKEIACSIRFAD